ncbi:MAG: hypothetical protein P4K80_07530 [Acidobacteriaceae bacterium]|nr:hypothetical protein [Acidobacteriaceae bacterium]
MDSSTHYESFQMRGVERAPLQKELFHGVGVVLFVDILRVLFLFVVLFFLFVVEIAFTLFFVVLVVDNYVVVLIFILVLFFFVLFFFLIFDVVFVFFQIVFVLFFVLVHRRGEEGFAGEGCKHRKDVNFIDQNWGELSETLWG